MAIMICTTARTPQPLCWRLLRRQRTVSVQASPIKFPGQKQSPWILGHLSQKTCQGPWCGLECKTACGLLVNRVFIYFQCLWKVVIMFCTFLDCFFHFWTQDRCNSCPQEQGIYLQSHTVNMGTYNTLGKAKTQPLYGSSSLFCDKDRKTWHNLSLLHHAWMGHVCWNFSFCA